MLQSVYRKGSLNDEATVSLAHCDAPYRVFAEHFDAMLYITNWGTRQLVFRFPTHIVPDDVMKA